MKVVSQQQILRIFEVTDSMSIHREAIVVPLGPQGSGKVELSNNKIQITVPDPDEGDFDSWISGLREQINNLDSSRVKKTEE